MQMRAGFYRLLRIVVVAGAALLAYRWLAPMGYGVVVLIVGAAGFAGWLVFRLLRARAQRKRDQRADRWAESLVIAEQRPAAIRELLEERAAVKEKKPAEYARLTLVLAELYEADGDAQLATEALLQVRESALTPALAAVIRHARAVAHLSAGNPEAAKSALDEPRKPSGEPSIELRIHMMRGLIAAELGDAQKARSIAAEARQEAQDDDDLMLEARVLEAVAFDAAGEREKAVERMSRLGDEMLDVLLILGLPRVRELAEAALGRGEGR